MNKTINTQEILAPELLEIINDIENIKCRRDVLISTCVDLFSKLISPRE